MRKLPLIAAAAAMTAVSVAPTAAYAGHRHRGYSNHYQSQQYNRGYDDRYYGRARQRCRSGTTGAIVGTAAGALLGRSIIGGRGNRTTGTIIGAAAGGLGGRALTRDKYCR